MKLPVASFVVATATILCPYCQAESLLTKDEYEDFGRKAVVMCVQCDRPFYMPKIWPKGVIHKMVPKG